VNAVAIKELAGSLKDPVAYPRLSQRTGPTPRRLGLCLFYRHSCPTLLLTMMLPVGNVPAMLLPGNTDRIVALKF
jgi:hypothetical protein